jgi:hypothetical protein
MAIGLATKTAIMKAILKEATTHLIGAVVTASVNIGSKEISNVII